MNDRIEPTLGGQISDADDPYRPGAARLMEDVEPRVPAIFDFSGRLSLARYWAIHLSLVVVVPWILIIFFLLGLKDRLLMQALAVLAIGIPSLLLSLSLLMRRARDLGWSPVWGVLATFLPILHILILLPLMTIPGSNRVNRYGPPNRPPNLTARILIAISIPLVTAGSAYAGWLVLIQFGLANALPGFFQP